MALRSSIREARAAAASAQSAAQGRIQQAESRRLGSEQALSELTGLLGSEEQLSPGFGVDPRILPYTGRYRLNTQAVNVAGSLEGARAIGRKRFDQALTEANDLMAMAEQEAIGGNFDAAEKLKYQAMSIVGGGSVYRTSFPSAFAAGFTLETDATQLARASAASPQGQIVGRMLREGRELLDRGPTYERMYSALTSGPFAQTEAAQIRGERMLATELREAQAGTRDLLAGRGASRLPYAQAALNARTAEQNATSRANLILDISAQNADIASRSAQFLEGFRLEFAQNVVGFAQAWSQNVPGILADFHAALDRLAETAVNFYANVYSQETQRLTQLQALREQAKAAKRAQILGLVGTIVGAVATVAGGGVGTLGLIGSIAELGVAFSGGSRGSVRSEDEFGRPAGSSIISTMPALPTGTLPTPAPTSTFGDRFTTGTRAAIEHFQGMVPQSPTFGRITTPGVAY